MTLPLVAGTDSPLGVTLWILGFLASSGILGGLIAKRVRPVITPLELLDQVQEERDKLTGSVAELNTEVRGLINEVRTERARGEAWRREALDRRDDLYRLAPNIPDYRLPALPEGLI